MTGPEHEQQRRWRLVLGGEAQDTPLEGEDAAVDAALAALYGERAVGGTGAGGGRGRGKGRGGGLGASAPSVARWLGDIRTHFPTPVVRVLQQDAMERLGLHELLLEPELLEEVEPDVHLVATLLSLHRVMPERTRATARTVVARLVEDLERRLARGTVAAVSGALDRSARSRRPRHGEIDWRRTVQANLRHWVPERRTVIPVTLLGSARRSRGLQREIVLAVDQSGSMASSLVHAAVLGSVLASVRTLRTSLVVFDTAVVDLSEHLADPVELLFATQLRGGTDIARALAYCDQLVTRPSETVLVLVSDLFEGGDRGPAVRRVAAFVTAGIRVVVLLALADDGAPAHDADLAADLAALGVAVFACTPDAFGELIAAAIEGRDLGRWADAAGFPTATAPGPPPA